MADAMALPRFPSVLDTESGAEAGLTTPDSQAPWTPILWLPVADKFRPNRPSRAAHGRTIADCYRFRNKLGLDIALDALTDASRGKLLKVDELNRIAKKLRVQRVMPPYLETVVS